MSSARGPLLTGLLALPLACGAQTPGEPKNPDQWLARIAQAGNTLEYRGVLVYAHDGRVESMRVARTLGPNGPREEIVSLNGEPRRIVRENGSVRCTDPVHGTTEVTGNEFPLLTFDANQLKTAADLYRIALAGEDRMAGLAARVLEARPSDETRYGYRLWVEPQSGMVLGSTLQGPGGAQVEQMMFTSISLTTSPPKLKPGAPAFGPPPPPGADATVAGQTPSEWRMGWLPPGFKLIAAPTAQSASRSHMLFSDGLAYVSVYIEPIAPNTQPMTGTVKRGAMNLYARPAGDKQIVVIGDVPAVTAERIGRSLIHDLPAAPQPQH